MEFHPILAMFDEALALRHPYFHDQPLPWSEGVCDYVAAAGGAHSPSGHVAGIAAFQNPHACVEFTWTVGGLVSAVLEAGLTLRGLREYPHSNGCRFFDLSERDPTNRWRPAPGVALPPQMLSLLAQERA